MVRALGLKFPPWCAAQRRWMGLRNSHSFGCPRMAAYGSNANDGCSPKLGEHCRIGIHWCTTNGSRRGLQLLTTMHSGSVLEMRSRWQQQWLRWGRTQPEQRQKWLHQKRTWFQWQQRGVGQADYMVLEETANSRSGHHSGGCRDRAAAERWISSSHWPQQSSSEQLLVIGGLAAIEGSTWDGGNTPW